jgi:hypothetical protein
MLSCTPVFSSEIEEAAEATDVDHEDSPVVQNGSVPLSSRRSRRRRRCGTCGKQCATLAKLRRHAATKHAASTRELPLTKSSVITCRRCGSRLCFSGISAPGVAACATCDNKTKTAVRDETTVSTADASHAVEERTSELPPRTCQNCGKRYSRQSKFEQHIGTIGKGGLNIFKGIFSRKKFLRFYPCQSQIRSKLKVRQSF